MSFTKTTIVPTETFANLILITISLFTVDFYARERRKQIILGTKVRNVLDAPREV